MGEGDAVSEKGESVANGNAEIEDSAGAVMHKKGDLQDGVKEMEQDKQDDKQVKAENMDVDKDEVNKCNENDEETAREDDEEIQTERDEQPTGGEVEKEENKSEEMEEDVEEQTKNTAEDKLEGGADGVKEKGENQEEPNKEKESEKSPRTKSSAGQKNNNKKISKRKKEKEPRTPKEKKTKESKTSVDQKVSETSVDKKEEPETPVVFSIDRPVRERKSVERLVATIEKDSAKEFHIEKGRGTALRDIPNVAYKFSRKKTNDTFKLLHTILFGRRGKAADVKNNLSRFSGFVWHDNEEKQMIKIKEKLDKCVKEKLVEFCDVLDLPISKANTRKEDIIAKLIEFFMAPHASTSELLAKKEQSSKGKKRKRSSKSASGNGTPSKDSAKSLKKNGSSSKENRRTKGTPDSEDESNKDRGQQKRGSAKSSVKKGSDYKSKARKKTISEKASLPPKETPVKSPQSRSKTKNISSAKKSSGKRDEIDNKSPIAKKSATKESAGKKVLKAKEKLKEEKLKPIDDKLRNAICEILEEVDFNTATFTDILKLLDKRFNTDLTPRKASIKVMIQDELTKLANAEEADEEEDEGHADKEKKLSTLGVKD